MREIKCDSCDATLEYPGALVFSPPEAKERAEYNICLDCWDKVLWHVVNDKWIK